MNNNNSNTSPASIRVTKSTKVMDAQATKPTISVLLPLSSQPPLVPPIPSSVKISSSATAVAAAVATAGPAGGRSTSRTTPTNNRDRTTTAGVRRTTNRDRSSTGTAVSFATISSTHSYSTTTSCSSKSSATRASRINDSPILSSPMFNMMSNNNNNNNNKNKNKNSSIVPNPEIGTGTMAGSRLSTSSTDVTMMGDATMARDDLEAEGGEAEGPDEESNSNSNSDSNHASNTLNQGLTRFRTSAAAAAKKQFEETKLLLDRRLNSKMDSIFFENNPSHKVPRFAQRGTYVFLKTYQKE
jgi:hypothetical protein